MKKILFSLFFAALTICNIFSQVKIGDNPTVISQNSILELESSNKGFLPPRVHRNVIEEGGHLYEAPMGTMVFVIEDSCINIKRDAKWFNLCGQVKNSDILSGNATGATMEEETVTQSSISYKWVDGSQNTINPSPNAELIPSSTKGGNGILFHKPGLYRIDIFGTFVYRDEGIVTTFVMQHETPDGGIEDFTIKSIGHQPAIGGNSTNRPNSLTINGYIRVNEPETRFIPKVVTCCFALEVARINTSTGNLFFSVARVND